MNCDEARPLVDASVDRELSAGDEWRLREHLAGCVDCQRVAERVRAVGQAVRAAPYHRAPAELRARIAAALASVEAVEGVRPHEAREQAADPEDNTRHAARPPRRRESWRERLKTWWQDRWLAPGGAAPAGTPARGAMPAVWMGATVLVLAALGAAIALNLRGSANSGAFVDELVASHVRAQLSGRDLDVPSSDRHTVKPWFNGRIDYAPPVEDLSAEGFPLVGGRLDYVGRERVAVLVYHYRRHVIDVYVFPPTASDGFALARWAHGGMTWWAVTDGGPEVLTAFRAALDARLGGG
jgi:anti-sigma factor RsiW